MSDMKWALLISGVTSIFKIVGMCFLIYSDYPWWSLLLLLIGFDYTVKKKD